MRKFVLTSPMFTGSVTFGYNEQGYLVYYSNESSFSDLQFAWFYNIGDEKPILWMPLHISRIGLLVTKIKGKIDEVPTDITFDAFWDAYANKKNRKRAEGLYNKMSEQQRLKCILSISPYLNYLSRVKWRNQADPDTYLRNEQYETDWNKQFK